MSKKVKNKPKDIRIEANPFNWEKWIPWFLVIGALLLYGWTYTFDFGLDDDYIIEPLSKIDKTFKGFYGLIFKWYDNSDYRPITMMCFWLERQLFGEIEAGTAHLLNVLLFGFLLTRIYKLLSLVSPFEESDKNKLFALLVSVLFLVHTNHVSVVANIKSRDSLLSMTFGLMASIQFILAWDKKQYIRYFNFILLMLIGLWSKLDCYSFLFFPTMSLLFFRKIETKKIVILVAIFLALFGIITHFRVEMMKLPAQSNFLTVLTDPGENPLTAHDTLSNRLSMACISLFYYIKFSIIPFGYYFFFGYNQIPLRPLFHPINSTILIVVISLFIWSIYYFKKNRLYLFSFLLFGIAILYALNIFNIVAGIVMDRYNFIPSFAFCILFATILIEILKLKSQKEIFNKVIIIIVVLFSVATLYRTSAWKDKLTLYLRDIPHLTNSYNANRILSANYVNLGLEYEYSQPELGDEYFKKADEYADKSHKIYQNAGATWTIKGINQLHWNDNRKALMYFKKSEEVDSTFYSGVNYVGVAYRNLGVMDSAFIYFEKVMRKQNNYNYSADNLIDWYIKMEQPEKLDSLIEYYKQRFPNDAWLNRRIRDLKNQGQIK